MENLVYDVAIIGGGASGIAAAVEIKNLNKNITVAVLEASDRILKKVLLTGNGRCNITNKDEDLKHYHSANTSFAEYALKKYDNGFIENFFDKIGLKIRYEENGKAYPYSYQASSVVDVLRNAVSENNISVFTGEKITAVQKSKDVYSLKGEKISLEAKYVVNAAGLLSGTDKNVTDGSGLNILKKLNIKTEKTYPSIVQIKTENSLTKQLKGIKINAAVSVICSGKVLRKEYGEVLFCDYGLSGPPILQLSPYCTENEGKLLFKVDILPEFSVGEVKDILNKRKENLLMRELKDLFNGFVNKKIGEIIVKECNLNLTDKIATLTDTDINNIAEKTKSLSFKVTGNMGYRNSQATLGGVSTGEIDNKSMQLKKYPHLYVIGELVDVTGDCGGYNLKWAWASAAACAENIAKEYNSHVDNK